MLAVIVMSVPSILRVKTNTGREMRESYAKDAKKTKTKTGNEESKSQLEI
jgi:hypothetical protein